VMIATYVFSFYLLAVIVRDFPLGLAYAIWAGAGTSLIVIVGAVRFGDSVNLAAVAGIALVILGIVTINVSGAH
jgi:small multidrug resistance pump